MVSEYILLNEFSYQVKINYVEKSFVTWLLYNIRDMINIAIKYTIAKILRVIK